MRLLHYYTNIINVLGGYHKRKQLHELEFNFKQIGIFIDDDLLYNKFTTFLESIIEYESMDNKEN